MGAMRRLLLWSSIRADGVFMDLSCASFERNLQSVESLFERVAAGLPPDKLGNFPLPKGIGGWTLRTLSFLWQAHQGYDPPRT